LTADLVSAFFAAGTLAAGFLLALRFAGFLASA
jgi:hypothetical protein